MYYILHFFKLKVIGKYGRKDVYRSWKRPQKISFDATRNAKKDIMGTINVNVW
jgi:hypothetical protein